MQHLILVSGFEEEFGIDLDPEEAVEMYKDFATFKRIVSGSEWRRGGPPHMPKSVFSGVRISGVAGAVPKNAVNNLTDHDFCPDEDRRRSSP